MAPKKAPIDPDDAPLKRLGGGRWRTRDERFTIEPQSGTWVVVDAEQTDDFGMPLVRGPFPSLTSAKDAISGARTAEPVTSPLAERAERRRSEPENARAETSRGEPPRTATPRGAAVDASTPRRSGRSAPSKPATSAPDEPQQEPGWLRDLEPAERGRARRAITRLTDLGVDDPEGVVRRDVVGDVPAIAAEAIRRRLAAVTDDTSPAEVAELLADGRDDELGVRWRIVDGGGRPILLEPQRRRR